VIGGGGLRPDLPPPPVARDGVVLLRAVVVFFLGGIPALSLGGSTTGQWYGRSLKAL